MIPIFIVGCGRSGTTLMRLILNRHSNIAIPEETWYFPQLLKEIGQLRAGNWRKNIATRVLELNRIHFPELTVEALEKSLTEVAIDDIQNIIPVVNREFMIRQGKSRWGDKTPGYVMHLTLFKKLFPEAKVIHMIRDGRDVVPSILKYWSVGPQTNCFIETAFYWKAHVERGMQEGSKYFGSSYKEVRYEDLVTKPERVVREICAFIGEEFEPAMLDASNDKADNVPAWEWHAETSREINTNNIYKWKKSMSDYHKAVMNYVGKNIYRDKNYDITQEYDLNALLDVYKYILGKSYDKFIYIVKRFLLLSFYKVTKRQA